MCSVYNCTYFVEIWKLIRKLEITTLNFTTSSLQIFNVRPKVFAACCDLGLHVKSNIKQL